jgi:hypothetical protein
LDGFLTWASADMPMRQPFAATSGPVQYGGVSCGMSGRCKNDPPSFAAIREI